MAEPLVIGGGGSTAVASETLLVIEERLRSCATTCGTAAGRLVPLTGALPGDRWNGTGAELEQAIAALRTEADALEWLTIGLRTAIDAYGWAESRARTWLENAIAPVASMVGFLAGRLAIPLLPSVLPVIAIAAGAWMLLPAASREGFERSGRAGAERLGGHLLDAPEVTGALRLLTTVADEAGLAALGVPPGMVNALHGLGVGSVATTAGALLGVGVLAGDRGRAPVTVARLAPIAPVASPEGVAERIARIPDSDRPVRVERYPGPRGDRFEVYIAGTASGSDGGAIVEGGENPWDMASNIALIAEHDASSLQAVRQALTDAGAGENTEVVFTGYSQGAAVATLLAESGDYATAGLVVVGAPTGGMPVTGDYPAVVLAHDDDPVTALGGPQQPTAAVLVTAPRGDGEWRDGDPVMAGHQLAAYRETAPRVDASGAPLLRDTIARLPGGDEGMEGEALRYTARRLDAGERCE